jgi:hypothetical protein
MLDRGDDVWLVTITLEDNQQPTYTEDTIRDFSKGVSKILTRLREWSKKAHHEILRVRFFGLKGRGANAPYQLHAHVICSWIPNPVHIEGDRYESAKLSAYARSNGKNLAIHIEKAYDPLAFARYAGKNIRELDEVDLPNRFERVSYTQNWAKLEWQKRRQQRRQQR